MTFDALHGARGSSGFATNSLKAAPRSEAARWDDPLVYLLAFVVGLVPIVAVLVRGGSWGAEPTVGVLFCGFSALGLLRRLRGTWDAGNPERDAKSVSTP